MITPTHEKYFFGFFVGFLTDTCILAFALVYARMSLKTELKHTEGGQKEAMTCEFSKWPVPPPLSLEIGLCASLRTPPAVLYFLTNYELSSYCK